MIRKWAVRSRDGPQTQRSMRASATRAEVVLDVKSVGKTYGSGEAANVAISDISFAVHQNEFVSIVGPSGCGKTTLIKIIAGLLKPSTGTVDLFGEPVTAVPDHLSVVFQDYSRSLFPWLRVGANVAFPLKSLIGREERERARAASRSPPSASPAPPPSIRGSCRAACSSASRSRAPSPTGRGSCSWTSRSPRSMRRPAPSSRT